MLIDLNDIAKACYQNKYETNKPPMFEQVDYLTDDNVNDLINVVTDIANNESYLEFRENVIKALKTTFALVYLKQINLNDFFNVSLNLNKP